MGEGARRIFGLALGDRVVVVVVVVRLGEVDRMMGDGMRTGEDTVFGLTIRMGEDVGDNEKDSGYLSGILTGVDGRRGLVSPLFGLNGCGRDRRGLPRGLGKGLTRGVPGVRVSELVSDFIPTVFVDSEGLAGAPGSVIGASNFPSLLKSNSSLNDSPKSSGRITAESIFIAGISG